MRVLVVAYYFPPLGGIGSIRMQRFATHLPGYGWDPLVLAPRNGSFHRDPSLEFPPNKTVRATSIELSRLGKRVTFAGGGDTEAAVVGGARATARAAARRWLYWPDAQIGWFPAAVRAGRRAIRLQRPEVIFSTSAPITSHLVARHLARQSGIPWVAEFRDPWSDGIADGDPRRSRAARIEARLVQEATAVVCPSPTWSALFEAKGARSVATITNGFDDAIASVGPPEDLVIGHLGSLYAGMQDLSALWRAVASLRHANELTVRLRFVGELAGATRTQLRDHGIEHVAEETGFLPHRDAVAAMASCSILLVPGPVRGGLDRGIIPAKTFEYLATDRPVLYVGDPAADAANLLDRLDGCSVVHHADTGGVLAVLAGDLRARPDRHVCDRYRRSNLTGDLAEVLDAAARNA